MSSAEMTSPALLGAYTLKGLSLAVDPVVQKLIPTQLIMYQVALYGSWKKTIESAVGMPGQKNNVRCIMPKELTITLDQDVYERLCRVVGEADDKRCSEYILKLVRGRVCSPYTNAEAYEPKREAHRKRLTLLEAVIPEIALPVTGSWTWQDSWVIRIAMGRTGLPGHAGRRFLRMACVVKILKLGYQDFDDVMRNARKRLTSGQKACNYRRAPRERGKGLNQW